MDNRLLRFLGRRGRLDVLQAMRDDPREVWHIRELAHAAGVNAMTASRAVEELEAMDAVEVLRPGREMQVTWRRAVASRFLRTLQVPDLPRRSADTFEDHYRPPRRHRIVAALYHWHDRGDDPGDPQDPIRVAIIVRRDEDVANDAIGPALDAVRRRGLPVPLAETVPQEMLGDDRQSRAILAGRRLDPQRRVLPATGL